MILGFAAGETSKTVSVMIFGDTAIEADETFSVVLTSASNSAVLGDTTGTATILNDDVTSVITNGNAGGILHGTSGNDLIDGQGGLDVIFARDGNDTVLAGDGNDWVDGGNGDDDITGGAGHDIVNGGAGNDRFIATTSDGNDVYFGGSGVDTMDYSAITANLRIDLGDSGRSAQTGRDSLHAIENAIGGSGDDRIGGTSAKNLLDGGAGNDRLSGEGGNDILIGGFGNDILNGGSGNDIFVFKPGFGNDIIADFDANPAGGQDLLDVRQFGITGFDFGSRIGLVDLGADTLVTIDGVALQTIRLVGISNPATIAQDDFLLM